MLRKILLGYFFIFWIILCINPVFSAWVINIEWTEKIEKVSLNKQSWTFVNSVNTSWFSLLWSIKTILIWVFVFYMVYAWIKMIMSLWTDDAKITSAKRQIWYWLIWIIFVSIPWTLYDAFFKTSQEWASSVTNWKWNWITSIVWRWFYSFIKYIIELLEIVIFFVALFMFIYTWIKLILWWKDQKVVSDAKLKILYSIVALILVWFIEIWKDFAFIWSMTMWIWIFKALANLLLYVTPLIWLFYLVMAWYYYITSWWDKEKTKKAKDIVIYIMVWALVFLCTYTVLLELDTFIS